MPTHSMTIHQASSLIDSLDELSLTVISKSSKFRRDSEASEPHLHIDENSTYSSTHTMMNNYRNVFSNDHQMTQSTSSINNRPQYQLQQQQQQRQKTRNYFSATESAGEETDNDSVFGGGGYDNTKPKQSYASITLRPNASTSASRDLNYFSDSEGRGSHFKVKPQRQSHLNNRSAQQPLPVSQPPPYQQYQPPPPLLQQSYQYEEPQQSTTKSKGSYSLLGQQQQHRRDLPTDNPYAPSPHAQVFKVPNIYDKLNMPSGNRPQPKVYQPQPQQTYTPSYYAPPPPEPPQYQPAQDFYATNRDYQDTRYKSSAAANVDEQELRHYEAEMGAELVKPANTKYSDSYFYNSPYHNYPTIDDQKKLAKAIASTLEGSDPSRSKYHKLKKRQLSRNSEADNEENSHHQQNQQQYYNNQSTSQYDSYLMSSPTTLKSPGYNSFAYDHNIPEIIRKSIEQAEMHDPVRMVQAPEQFKQLHYAEHNTHTEMPPQAAMSLAAALTLSQGGGRGAAIFQKRKAKSEKWVVDETNVKTPVGNMSFFGPPQPQMQQPIYETPHGMSKLLPIAVKKEPLAPLVVQQKAQDVDNQNKFSDFNVKPKGWSQVSSAPEDYSKKDRKPVNLAIDHLIREGIQELHIRDSQPQQQQRRTSQQSDTQSYNSLLFGNQQPNKLDLSQHWNPAQQSNNQRNANISISKDGIQNLKQRFYQNAEPITSSTNRYSNYEIPVKHEGMMNKPVISKVKLNRLNTNDFLSNFASEAQPQQQQPHQQHQHQQYQQQQQVSDFNVYNDQSSQYNRQQQTNNSYRNFYDEDVAASDL